MIEKLKGLVNKKVVIGGILLALILCCLVLVLQVGVFPFVQIESSQKAKVAVTAMTFDQADTSAANSAAATAEPQNLPGVVSLGMTVVVSGTGVDGLRMRAQPGTDQSILFIASEGEIFTIVDGPVIEDSLIWWKIQSNEDAQKIGWSVQDYLQATQP